MVQEVKNLINKDQNEINLKEDLNNKDLTNKSRKRTEILGTNHFKIKDLNKNKTVNNMGNISLNEEDPNEDHMKNQEEKNNHKKGDLIMYNKEKVKIEIISDQKDQKYQKDMTDLKDQKDKNDQELKNKKILLFQGKRK